VETSSARDGYVTSEVFDREAPRRQLRYCLNWEQQSSDTLYNNFLHFHLFYIYSSADPLGRLHLRHEERNGIL
jgi:hypothetical protein